jgi:hypothetical protein
MPKILIIDKNCTKKEVALKEIKLDELYKKAGFKTPDGFDVQANWKADDGTYNIQLYAKTHGKAGNENKYDFPPPVDVELFYGSGVLVNMDNAGNFCDITKAKWEKIYFGLFEGFEELSSDDSDDDMDDDEDAVPKTKEGYGKDGFVVDEDDDEDEDDSDEDSDDDTILLNDEILELLETLEAEEAEADDDDDDDDTDMLCEDDDDDDDDLEEDEDEEEDTFYDSDMGGAATSTKKKPTKKPVVKKTTKPVKPTKPIKIPVVAASPVVATEPVKKRVIKAKTVPAVTPADNVSYLNCSNELVEESYE